MVIKNLENKIKLVGIICSAFLMGCIIISVSSIWTARCMVTDAQQKVYVLDGNVPILVNRTTMEETLDVEAKSHIEMFHHYFFTLAPDDKYIRYSMEKAMYLVDETGLAQYNTLKEKGFYNNIMGTSAVFSIFCDSIKSKEEEIVKSEQLLEERKKDLEVKKNELDEIISETKQEEEKLREKAKNLEATIEPRLLQAFKRIRKNSRNGLGITYVQRDACGGCFNKIPPQKQLDIRMRKKIIVCEYCGRIMIDPELAGVETEKHLETKMK
jgi:conjugative transposon TraK protein